jgi:tetratricopeptide (TPR) repeat protein
MEFSEGRQLAVDVETIMKAIPQELKLIISRSIWIYLAVILIFAWAVDYEHAAKERAHYLLGIFYNEDLKNYTDGEVYFDYMTHHKPQDAYSHFLLGYCYLQSNDYRRGERYLNEAVRLAPQETMYQRYLDIARTKMNDPHANVVYPSEQIVIPLN